MSNIFNTAAEAMATAYAVAQQTGKRVWRHPIPTNGGAIQWLVSLESDSQIALQGLTG